MHVACSDGSGSFLFLEGDVGLGMSGGYDSSKPGKILGVMMKYSWAAMNSPVG